MTKKVRRLNVAKGTLVPLGNGFSLAIGKHPEKVDDIDIGPNNKNGLSVNHGEIIQNTGNNIRVFSAEPMLGGQSPAQLLYRGANPNAIFAAQEHWKDVHRVNDDGSHYKKGGRHNTPVKETNKTSVQRDSAQVNIFKPGDNSRIQANRAKHRISLENFVKNNPTLYGLNTSDFVDFLLDNATMESENSSTASHGSMYGYYQLKGLNKKSTEDQQHHAAFKHLANLFNNVLTDADIRRANKLGISQAQLLHKTWNQERKVLNYLYQGKDNSDGLGTKISDWGNNNSLEMDYSPYVMKAVNDNNIIIKQGDTPEGILKAYRGAGLEKRTFNNHAKDFQTIFGKSPNNLQINDVLTNEYLVGPRKPNGTFKYGGSLINQSLGERPNAKFGKEMENKRNKAYEGRIQPIGSIGFRKPFIDQYGNTIGINGNITKLATPKETLTVPSITAAGNNGSKGLTAIGADAIGMGISALGSIGGALIESHALDKLKATPHQYTIMNPVKLKTKVNIGPQVATMRDTVAKVTDAARRTSASSRSAYQKIADARLAGARQIASLYGEKENKETALINQDRMNQQHVGMTNAQNIMNTINGNIDRRTNIENTKAIGKANAWINAINNISGSAVGPTGLMARHEARRSQAANLSTMALAHPNAAKLMQGDNWTRHFSGFYDMLNKQYLG